MKLKSLLFTALAALAAPIFAADVIVSGQINANTTWTSNNRYQLQGKVYVVNGATLTIEPGTIIQGRVSSGNDAAALVITRGSKIMADGTPSRPIIFTSELDQLNGNLTAREVGLWGGVVILGNATLNSRANAVVVPAPVTDQIEGIVISGADAALTTFGGTNDDDNSGVFRYVSIRHGGAIVGTANELNGLSLGGVGRGTTIEYVEVFANRDDGFEWFGGTVNCKYLVAAFCGDDSFDYDQGYRGNLQFLFAIQADNRQNDSDDGYQGDKAFELNGAPVTVAGTSVPLGGGAIFNATAIGIGTSTRPSGASGANNIALHLRGNGSHKIYNSVFVDYANIFQIDADEQPRIDAGDFVFANNTFFSHLAANNNVNPSGAVGVFASGTGIRPTVVTSGGNSNIDAMLRNISRDASRTLDPRPAVGSPLLNASVTAPTSPFLTATTYRGAFGGTNWAAGWTKLWTEGWFSLASVGDGTDTPIISGSANKFINISTRGFAGLGDQTLVAGFVIPAGQAQTVLIRGVGPTLGTLGVSGVLADPVLEVYRAGSTAPIATNDNWSGAQVSTLAGQVGAFALGAGSADAALVLNLEPGNYTAQVKGKGTATGVAILEVYEVD